jgi:hypothetical protein
LKYKTYFLMFDYLKILWIISCAEHWRNNNWLAYHLITVRDTFGKTEA